MVHLSRLFHNDTLTLRVRMYNRITNGINVCIMDFKYFMAYLVSLLAWSLLSRLMDELPDVPNNLNKMICGTKVYGTCL